MDHIELEANKQRQEVIVTDIRIKFTSLVYLLIQLVFAAIPAALIIGAIALMLVAIAATLFR